MTTHFIKEEAVAVTSRTRPDISRSAAAFAISVREQCHLSQVHSSSWANALMVLLISYLWIITWNNIYKKYINNDLFQYLNIKYGPVINNYKGEKII